MTGFSVSTVLEARRAATAPLSLEVPATPDGATLESVIADERATDPALEAMRGERSSRLATAVAALPARRRQVVEQSFGLGEPPRELTDVAAAMHVTPQRIRTITNSALHELHTALRATGMTD